MPNRTAFDTPLPISAPKKEFKSNASETIRQIASHANERVSHNTEMHPPINTNTITGTTLVQKSAIDFIPPIITAAVRIESTRPDKNGDMDTCSSAEDTELADTIAPIERPVNAATPAYSFARNGFPSI